MSTGAMNLERLSAASWRVLALLGFSVFMSFVDRGNLSIAAPLLKDELHLSASRLGLSEAAIVREVAEKAARRITRKVVATLQQMKDTLSGDDSELKTTWDEICAQVRLETSTFWDAYDDTVRAIVEAQLAKLSDHEREAIWLQTDAGIDWSCEEMDEGNVPPICDADIVDWVTNEHVYGEAANWSNARIRAFIERSTVSD